MAKLTARRRRKVKKSQYGLPGQGKYPMPDKAHAANAKARSTQEHRKGRLSKQAKDKVHAKANRKLGKGRKRKG